MAPSSSSSSSSLPPPLQISPPLVNTANPSATDLADLTALYDCPFTGAVTTRTSLLNGFPHDPAIHQYALFDVAAHDPAACPPLAPSASLNCLGYSPLPLDTYLGFIAAIAARPAVAARSAPKGFLVSVTGSPEDVAGCYRRIAAAQATLPVPPQTVPLAVEINLSCPNIPNKPPPAYDGPALEAYLRAVEVAIAETKGGVRLPVGLKTPPYTHAGQFATLVGALKNAAAASPSGVCPISFLTATNTLGTCLVMTKGKEGTAVPSTPSPAAALPGPGGLGGLAGAPLHPLALGNVATLRAMLDAEPATLGHIQIVGAGGVADAGGFERMRSVGAFAVGVGTGILLHGVDVFGKIAAGAGAAKL